MISITRSTLRNFRNVLRRACISRSQIPQTRISVSAASEGLRIAAISHEFAIEYEQPGKAEPARLFIPAALLHACEGRTDEIVTLAPTAKHNVLATWTDRGIPQAVEFEFGKKRDADYQLPAMPETFRENPPALREAFKAAATIVDRESSHYALSCMQLRGSQGRIAATDGRQALIQSGFEFPWAGDLLVPGSSVFAAREVPEDAAVHIGQVDDWVVVAVGYWKFWLRVDRTGHFPKVDDLVTAPSAAKSTLSIDELDAEFLGDALTRLPADAFGAQPLTLDLNGQVAVRGCRQGQSRATELVLSRSRLQGEPLILNMNRCYLARALELSFREVYFFSAESVVLCDDGRRQYLWMPLASEGAIQPSEEVIRIESATHVPDTKARIPKPTRRRTTVNQATSDTAGQANGSAATENTVKIAGEANSSMVQAIALRAMLREAVSQSNQLIRALKREKRNSRLVASTLASLKQLQKVAS